jgi:hypothetical protein
MNKSQSTGGTVMRLSHAFILAGALLVAAPAVAQGNAAAPDNTAATNAAAPAATAPTAPEATPADQNAGMSQAQQTTADTGMATGVKPTRRGGFPWGVLGLLGLIGLFGVRKVKA